MSGTDTASDNSEASEALNYLIEHITPRDKIFHVVTKESSNAPELILKGERVKYAESYLDELDDGDLKIFYDQVVKDGLPKIPEYRSGFQILRRLMVQRKLASMEEINRAEGCVALYNTTIDENDRFWDMETGEDLDEVSERYSRIKFGSVDDAAFFGKRMAAKVIERIETDPSLAEVFRSAKENNEYIYAMVPGSRNVRSIAYQLRQDVIERVNVYLTQQGLPTIILKNTTRLQYRDVNYAELNDEQRKQHKLSKRSSTIVPTQEFQEFPIHVLFVDDVEITGTTIESAREKCLNGGAKSFHTIFAMKFDPEIAHERPSIEDFCNKVVVKGNLDDVLADIINHPEFKPVQRIIRIILGPENRDDLNDFLGGLSDKSMIKVFRSALSNDFLWLKNEHYGPSLIMMREHLFERGLVDENGLLT